MTFGFDSATSLSDLCPFGWSWALEPVVAEFDPELEEDDDEEVPFCWLEGVGAVSFIVFLTSFTDGAILKIVALSDRVIVV